MSESLILEKLESLSSEIQSLKQEVQELKKGRQDGAAALTAAVADQPENKDLALLKDNLLDSVNEINAILFKVKAANELLTDIEPVTMQAYPKVIEFFEELDGQFSVAELSGVLRSLLTNLHSINEGIDLLRMGIELRDDLIPVAQIAYPKLLKYMNDLHEGEFQGEQIATLLHTLLLNIHTFSDLLNMAKPLTELVKDVQMVIRETDVLHSLNTWLESMQQSSGVFKLAGSAFAAAKKFTLTDEQLEALANAISEVDLQNVKPVTPFGAIKYLRDPQVQEALGAIFMILQASGACLQAFQKAESR